MAWTAQLTKVETVSGNANISITLQLTSDSGEVQTRVVPSDTWTDESIAIWAQGAVVGLENRDAILADLKAKTASGPAAIVLPRDGFPTPERDAQAASFASAAKVRGLADQLSRLTTLQSAASAGLIAADDPDLVAAQKVATATVAASSAPVA